LREESQTLAADGHLVAKGENPNALRGRVPKSRGGDTDSRNETGGPNVRHQMRKAPAYPNSARKKDQLPEKIAGNAERNLGSRQTRSQKKTKKHKKGEKEKQDDERRMKERLVGRGLSVGVFLGVVGVFVFFLFLGFFAQESGRGGEALPTL